MRWMLSVKLVLGIAVIMTATMGSALLLLTINTRNLMMEDFSRSAIHLSDVADAGLENAMISRKQEEIANIMQAIGRREGIEGGAIFDARGEIKYSIDPEEVGRILTEDDPTCRLCHGATPKDRPQTIILPSKQGVPMLRVARPLYNQPRCQGCHRERKLGMLVIDFSLAGAERKTMAVISKQLRCTLTVAVIIIAALIGFVYLMVTRPLAHFVRIIRAINEGDLNRRVNLSRKDEIGELAASFDGMVQRINAHTRELEALNDMATTVGKSLDLQEILPQVVEKVCRLSGTEGAAIHLPDERTGELVLAASHGIPPPILERLVPLKPGQSVADWFAETGKPFLEVENTATDPRAEAGLGGWRSLVVVPLRFAGKMVGALGTGNVTQRRFTPGEVALFQAIGNQLGVAIENARLHAEMQRLSQTDPLTGLFNRRGLDERMQIEILRAKRYRHPLSVVMIDIDHFKNYNDAHSHLEGDVILKQVAELFRIHVRETDVVARFGGEEFLILLTETAKAEALEVAEKIRAAVSVRPFLHAGTQPEGKLTISLGVATSSADLSEAQELIDKADHALYGAKNAGRNRVREA
jgi:diguanylate cyclase (GGDEF)-like protein